MSRARILVVDDEPAILRALARLLRDYDVATTCDPVDALEILTSGIPPFDVVLCDISMPVLSGIELYARAIDVRPELDERFVFISGNGDRRSIDFLAQPGRVFVRKPFDRGELEETIALVLVTNERNAR